MRAEALLALLAALLVGAIATGTAAAAVVSESGETALPRFAFTAAPQELNDLRIVDDGVSLLFDDVAPITAPASGSPGARCVAEGENVRCTYGAPQRRSVVADVALGDGDDRIALDAVRAATVAGGDGNDLLRGSAETGPFTFFSARGDAGNDRIESGGANFGDADGGPGDDVLLGPSRAEGFTNLRGGDGADRFEGGPGRETVRYDGSADGSGDGRPVRVTVDDVPDDGRAGEGDDVRVGTDFVVGSLGDDVLLGSPADDGLLGSSGRDLLDGGPGDDRLLGGPGDDRMLGGADADTLVVGARDGADVMRGGSGPDRAVFEDPNSTLNGVVLRPDVRVTFDDRPDDGPDGEGDDVGRDVEDATAAFGNDTLLGDERVNRLAGTRGNDLLTGGGGRDDLNGGDGDDRIEARDGEVDRVDCGPGTDRASVDTSDILSGCEVVDEPPSAEPPAPAPPGAVPGTPVPSTGPTMSEGPRPPVTTRRTPAGLTLALRPARDRRASFRFTATGRLVRPAGVTTRGCRRGVVAVTVKRGTRTISTRRVRLGSGCAYTSTVVFRDRRRLGRTGRVTIIARFAGTATLAPISSSRRTVRAG